MFLDVLVIESFDHSSRFFVAVESGEPINLQIVLMREAANFTKVVDLYKGSAQPEIHDEGC